MSDNTTSGETVLQLSDVTVRKDKGVLLDAVSFTAKRNEFIGIVGPNGAGKTTLLNTIAGFEKFEGTLKIFGRPEGRSRSRASRLNIGYVPQVLHIDAAFPILASEAIMTGAAGRIGPFRSPGRKEKGDMMRLMEMMRVAHLADRPFGHLSGGERQKISLARAILQEPQILLMDEPTANLDIAVQKEVLDLIDDIHRHEKITFLFVTHDFTMLPAAMDRVILLDGGRIVFDGNAEQAMSGEMLSRLFRYPLETFTHNGRRFISYD